MERGSLEYGGEMEWNIEDYMPYLPSGTPKNALRRNGILNAFSRVLYIFISFTCKTSLSANANAWD
jgi:hypothetical protein